LELLGGGLRQDKRIDMKIRQGFTKRKKIAELHGGTRSFLLQILLSSVKLRVLRGEFLQRECSRSFVVNRSSGLPWQNSQAQRAKRVEPRKGLQRYPFARLSGQKIQAESPVFCAAKNAPKNIKNVDKGGKLRSTEF
jgi:hypothetical protein